MVTIVLDKFGITELNPTKAGGLEWFCNWSNGKKRTVKSQGMSQRNGDKYDSMFSLHCPSYKQQQNVIEIGGKGRATLRGQHPRIYICKKDGSPVWGDVEITCYSKIIKTYPDGVDPEVPAGKTYTTFRLAARSNHHLEYKCICNGMGYNSEFFIGGNARLRKELMHHGPGLSHYANAAGTHVVYPLGEWVGHKFIVKTLSESPPKVLLQTFVDNTNGGHGGVWTKAMEYVDDGNWAITGSELKGIEADITSCTGDIGCVDGPPCPPKGPYNKVIVRQGGSCYLRTDWVKDSVWKNFSIREI